VIATYSSKQIWYKETSSSVFLLTETIKQTPIAFAD